MPSLSQAHPGWKLPTVVTAAIARELSGSQSPLNSGFLFSRKALTASR